MTTNSSPSIAVRQGLGDAFLGSPVEICIVTPNLMDTLAGLVRLGIGPFKICKFNSSTVTEQTLRGEPAEFAIDVAFAEQGTMVWEIMQPVSGPTLMQQFLDGTNGRGGIQHVSFDCAVGKGTERGEGGAAPLIGDKAREEALRRRGEFEGRGFPMVQSGIWHGKKGTCEFMFFDTNEAVNTCFESYVFSDDWEDPEDTEYYPAAQLDGPHNGETE